MDEKTPCGLYECICKDWAFVVEKARQGLLSPYWQQAYLKEMRRFGLVIPQADEFLALLQKAIREKPQISDEEDARRNMEQKGMELLFFFLKDHKTRMEITFDPLEKVYSVSAALDTDQPEEQRKKDAEQMEAQLDSWCRKRNISLDKSAIEFQKIQAGCRMYWTMEQALLYCYGVLRWPELL